MNVITKIKTFAENTLYVSLGHLTSSKDFTTVKLTDKQYINKTEQDVNKEQFFRPYTQFVKVEKEYIEEYFEGSLFIRNSNLEGVNVQEKIIKILLFLIITIILIPITIVESSNSIQETPLNLINDLINTFTVEELQEFNDRVAEQNLTWYRRILIAILINASIYIIFRYGSDIMNNVWETIRSIPETINNATNFIFANARDIALKTAANATPEQRADMLEIARNILRNRNGAAPVA